MELLRRDRCSTKTAANLSCQGDMSIVYLSMTSSVIAGARGDRGVACIYCGHWRILVMISNTKTEDYRAICDAFVMCHMAEACMKGEAKANRLSCSITGKI